MGSSAKVLLTGAISLIVGVYAISLKNVQTTNLRVAQSQVDRVQNERLVDAGLVIALDKLKGGKDATGTVNVLGRTIKYEITPNGIQKASITLTLTEKVDGVDVILMQLNAEAKKDQPHKKGFRKIHRGDWQITSVHNQQHS